MQETDQLLTEKEVRALLHCSHTTLWRITANGTFPAPIKLGRLNRWQASKINQWIAQQASAQGASNGN